jgi:hypothetical protein
MHTQESFIAARRKLGLVIGMLLLVACGRFVNDDSFPDETQGEWGVGSLQLVEEVPNLLEFENGGTPARIITIDDTTIYGSLGCEISAEYSYNAPVLELGDFFMPSGGEDVDSPCDAETWQALLEETQEVSFPESDQMVWSSEASILTFVRLTSE